LADDYSNHAEVDTSNRLLFWVTCSHMSLTECQMWCIWLYVTFRCCRYGEL